MNQMVIIVECSRGNETVGDAWLETGIFDENTPLHVVRDWAAQIKHHGGKVILTEPVSD